MAMNYKLTLLGLAAVLTACGGGDKPASETPASDTTAAAAAPVVAPAAAPATQGNVIEVHMVTAANGASGTFEPAAVTAKKGDTVRFITDGKTVHNVSFPAAENVGKSGLPASPGPYLSTPDQSFDVVVTMDAGTYNFQCDPHAAMGMKGTLTVQ